MTKTGLAFFFVCLRFLRFNNRLVGQALCKVSFRSFFTSHITLRNQTHLVIDTINGFLTNWTLLYWHDTCVTKQKRTDLFTYL